MERSNYRRNKAAKEKENLEISTNSVNTNNHFNYITDRNDNMMDYNYRKKYKDEYDYIPKFRKDSERKYKRNEEFYDDYSTSATTYEESIKKSRITSPQSKSDYEQTRRHDNRKSNRHYSPVEDYDYFTSRDSPKRRSKLTKSDMKNLFYQYETEKDMYKKPERKSRSPRRRHDYDDHIFEEPGEKYDYEKYFEKTIQDKKSKKYTNEDKVREDRLRNNNLNDYQRKYNDYKVFSYKGPKLHEKVLRPREKVHEKTSLNSEIEIGNIDYPVLAFKDNEAEDKSSDMVYLPIVVFDKKSKSQGSPRQGPQSNQLKNIQVFATNLKDKSVFTYTENNDINEQKAKDQDQMSELQTEESLISRDTKLKEDSNVRTSTETQTEESLIFKHNKSTTESSDNTIHGSTFQKVEETQTDDSLFFQPNRPRPQGYKNAGSILGSIIKKVDLKSTFRDNRSSKGTKKYEPSVKNKKLFAYQIDVDIEPVKNNVFLSTVSKREPINLTNQFEYKEIEDSLHDNYPVTKDYIKVSDNSSEQIKANMIKKISKQPGSPTRTTTPINLISRSKQTEYAKSNRNSGLEKFSKPRGTSKENKHDVIIIQNHNSHQDQFVIKDIPEAYLNKTNKYISDYRSQRGSILKPKLEYGSQDKELDKTISKTDCLENLLGIKSKDLQVFRSTINNANNTFRNSTIIPRTSQINSNRKSVLSEDRNRHAEEFQSKQETLKGEGDPEIPKERISMARQRDSRIVDRKSQSIIRESRINKSKSATGISGNDNEYQTKKSKTSIKKGQSVVGQSEVDLPNFGTNFNEDADEYQIKNTEISTKSPTDNTTRPKQSKTKSILRTFSFSKRKSTAKESVKPIQSDNISIQEEHFIPPHNLEPNDERKTLGTESERKETKSEIRPSRIPERKSKASKGKLTGLFSRSKSRTGSRSLTTVDPLVTSTRESGPSRKSTRKSGLLRNSARESGPLRRGTGEFDTRKSGVYAGTERKTGLGPSEENETNKKASRTGFSRLSSVSKSRIGPVDDGDVLRRNAQQSKTNLSLTEKNQAPSKDSKFTSLQKRPSQLTQNQKKPTRQYSQINQLPQSKSQEKAQSQISKKKSKSKTWSFLRRSKAKEKPDTGSTEMMPSQQQDIMPPHSEGSSETIVEDMNKSESVDRNKSELEDKDKTEPENKNKKEPGDKNENKEDKQCECVVKFVKQARECSNFFLGTTLHEQIMDVLKVI